MGLEEVTISYTEYKIVYVGSITMTGVCTPLYRRRPQSGL